MHLNEPCYIFIHLHFNLNEGMVLLLKTFWITTIVLLEEKNKCNGPRHCYSNEQ